MTSARERSRGQHALRKDCCKNYKPIAPAGAQSRAGQAAAPGFPVPAELRKKRAADGARRSGRRAMRAARFHEGRFAGRADWRRARPAAAAGANRVCRGPARRHRAGFTAENRGVRQDNEMACLPVTAHAAVRQAAAGRHAMAVARGRSRCRIGRADRLACLTSGSARPRQPPSRRLRAAARWGARAARTSRCRSRRSSSSRAAPTRWPPADAGTRA